MSRRRRSDDSSLELLLDTICNTFGGVLFLAMLVSLLLQNTRNRTSLATGQDHPPQPAVSKADVIRLTGDAREMAEELQQLEAELARIRGFAKEFSSPGFVESLEKLHAEQQRQRSLEVRRVQLLAAIAAENTAAASAAAGADATREKAKVAVATSAEAAAQLKTAEKKHAALLESAIRLREKVEKKNVVQSTGKAPRERETDKQEFGLIMRYGRIYLTHIHTGFGRRVNTKDFTIENAGLVTRAKAKPHAGIDICANDADAALQQLLVDYPAADWYPCVVVHPDSYDAFQVLKSKLVAKGYEYRVIATNKPVADSGGRGRVQ